jgi:uncharacterized membrane protein YkoI
MASTCRIVVAALVAVFAAFALAPARAEEAGRPVAHPVDHGQERGQDHGYECLNQKERRTEAENGVVVVRLATAMHVAKARMPGTVVRARLCESREGLVYVLTVLGHDGKVARLTVDAVKGTLVGGL